MQNDIDGNPLGQVGFAIASAFLFIAVLAFIAWIYRSITNVRVVLLLKDSAGVRWELERVIRDGAASKTLFLLDPAIKDDGVWQNLAQTVVPLLQSATLAPDSFGLQSRPIGFYFDGGKLVQIVNANRTATSYRTAFSHFLATPLASGKSSSTSSLCASKAPVERHPR